MYLGQKPTKFDDIISEKPLSCLGTLGFFKKNELKINMI